jgi:hypothetical protein
MNIVIKTNAKVERETVDRIFSEAYEKISVERQRVGEEKLKAQIWGNILNYNNLTIESDGYIVGIITWVPMVTVDNVNYIGTRLVAFGKDQNGSRAWFYSEEFQKVLAETIAGTAGLISILNPASPAAQAIAKIFGVYKYFGTTEIIDSEDYEHYFVNEGEAEQIRRKGPPYIVRKLPLL